jgi:hypothetical protein
MTKEISRNRLELLLIKIKKKGNWNERRDSGDVLFNILQCVLEQDEEISAVFKKDRNGLITKKSFMPSLNFVNEMFKLAFETISMLLVLVQLQTNQRRRNQKKKTKLKKIMKIFLKSQKRKISCLTLLMVGLQSSILFGRLKKMLL